MSTILKPLVELLHWVLMWIHDSLSSLGLSEDWTWGLAIIGITIIVRLLMFPLTWKQYRSSRAMQALAPHIKELQKKYKNDRKLLQQETMRLYSEHKVNPFASCLPLIIQMPVFFALYYTIRGTDYLPVEQTDALYNASFLWLPKLGEPDPYYILLVIYVTTQLISTLLMLTPQMEGFQRWMMLGMPVFFVFFLYRLPVRPLRLLGDDQPVDHRPAAPDPQGDADRAHRGDRGRLRSGEGAAARAAGSPRRRRSAGGSWRRSWPPRSRPGAAPRNRARRRRTGARPRAPKAPAPRRPRPGRRSPAARRAANGPRPARAQAEARRRTGTDDERRQAAVPLSGAARPAPRE